MTDRHKITQNRGFYFTGEFWLILLVCFLPTLTSLVEDLWAMHALGTSGDERSAYYQILSTGIVRWLIADLLPSIVGVLVISALAFAGIIDIGRLKWDNVLTALLLAFLCNEQFGYNIVDLGEWLSVSAGAAASEFGVSSQLFSLVAIWRWFILCIYLLAASERIRKASVFLMIMALILVVWSVLMTILDVTIYRMLSVPDSLIAYVHDISSWFYRTTWINRMVVLGVALTTGKAAWRWGTTILCILVKVVLTALLISPFIFQFSMGLAGLALAEFFPYLVIGVICIVNHKVKLKRIRQNS